MNWSDSGQRQKGLIIIQTHPVLVGAADSDDYEAFLALSTVYAELLLSFNPSKSKNHLSSSKNRDHCESNPGQPGGNLKAYHSAMATPSSFDTFRIWLGTAKSSGKVLTTTYVI